MNCKSCDFLLNETAKYCTNCGSKIVNKRLSLKGTWAEFIGPFFNWENTFFKTIHHLITKPKLVLEAYISGARKKYYQPFAFLILYGSVGYLVNKLFPFIQTEDVACLFEDFDPKAFSFSTDYFSLITIVNIPILALSSYLALKKYGNNYSEHMVFQCYITSFYGFMIIILQLLLVNLLKMNSLIFFFSSIFVVPFVYANYVFIEKYNLTFKSTVFVNLKYFGLILLLSTIFFGIVIIGLLIYSLFWDVKI